MRTLFKVLITLFIVFVGAVALLVLGGVYVARHVRVHETEVGDHKNVQIETPFGNLRVNKNNGLEPASVGIPVYPGAQRDSDHGGGASFEFDGGELHKDLTIAAANYFTSDAPDKVRDYYRHEFPTWKTHWENDGMRLEVKENGQMRTIFIRPKGDGTRIAIASVGAPASN